MATDQALIARLAEIPVAVISDVLRAAGVPHHTLHYSVTRLYPGPTLVGPAFCVRGQRVLGGVPPRVGPDPRHEMFRRVGSGEIVVIASDNYEDAVVLGENVVIGLQQKGCRGIVTDGGIRDRDAIGALNIPIYARFATPLSSGKQWAISEIDVPVALRGQSSASVTINPGDLIAADGDGVVVIPREGAQSISEDAAIVVEHEGRHRAALLAGTDPGQIYRTVNRFSHVRSILVAADATT
jgi:4-hydroxy-4-methyl-2-oxoglutarate aldolase